MSPSDNSLTKRQDHFAARNEHSNDEDLPLISPDEVEVADVPQPVSVPDGAPIVLPQSQESANEDRSLIEVLSTEGAPVEMPLSGAAQNTSAGLESTDGLQSSAAGEHTDAQKAAPRIETAAPSEDPRMNETMEGLPVVFNDSTELSAVPPPAGKVLLSNEGREVFLDESLGEQAGSVFYRARLADVSQAFTAVWMAENPRAPAWDLLPDPRLVRPAARVSLGHASLRLFERPKGNTVIDYMSSQSRQLPAMAALELGIELAEILENLHGAGMFIYDLDPSQIVVERSGRVRLYAINGFFRHDDMPSVYASKFAAPEVRQRFRYRLGAHSDVFSVALLVYCLLARRAPVDESLDPQYLCSPRVFRPECPLGIWPYLRDCLTRSAETRVGHAAGLRMALSRARARLLEEVSAREHPPTIKIEAWGEMHTGLGKARRGAPQQDRAVSLTGEGKGVGLYLVADGVSRSKYGDGAFASEQVEGASVLRWTALEKAGPEALKLNHPQRADVLRQIVRSAGKRIASEVNRKCAPVPNEPNQVMSTTVSAAYIVNSEATVANLGDSRSYLIRDDVIERVAIDHDRSTDALRMGLSFHEAATIKMGSALTRVVGRVLISEDGVATPDPFDPEIFRLQLLPGDRLLLCSDGIPDYAAGVQADQRTAEEAMLEVVQTYPDPARAAFELVVLSNRGGGHDNISCVVIAVVGPGDVNPVEQR